MTPRQYVAGTALTLIVSISFWSWVIYTVIGVPLYWMLPIVAFTAIVTGVGAVKGCNAWIRANAQLSSGPWRDATQTALTAILPTIVLSGVLSWLSAYAIWRREALVASIAAVAAGMLALHGIRRLRSRPVRDGIEGPSMGGQPSLALEEQVPVRTALLVFNAALPAAISAMFFFTGEWGVALILLVPSAGIAWWLLRKINR
jgi:hypothetical protein